MNPPLILLAAILFLLAPALHAQPGEMTPGQTDAGQMNGKEAKEEKNEAPLSLITDTPEEGFQVAVKLARKGVTTTQPNKEILFMLREVYARDPDSLIASSQVIAIYFQTVAAANNYWREGDVE